MGRYANAGQLVEIQPVFFGTAGLSPNTIEFFIETREDEIDARLGRYWNMQPFSGNPPSMLKTLAKLGAWVDVRKSKISMEDPSVSQWITQDETKFETLITQGRRSCATQSGPRRPSTSRRWTCATRPGSASRGRGSSTSGTPTWRTAAGRAASAAGTSKWRASTTLASCWRPKRCWRLTRVYGIRGRWSN